MPTEIVNQPFDISSFYSQVKMDYDQQKGIIHGLAKDSIQNCAGHRISDKAEGWGAEIELIKNENNTILTFTDWGTTGLIGHVPKNEDHATELRDSSPEEKLARIEMILHSGNNVSGAAGSKGRGLTVFQHNSSINKVMFESLRAEGSLGYDDASYVANARFVDNTRMRQYITTTDDEAKKFIFEHAGLKPISKVGTRITIFKPNEDLIESIKNGEFSTFISSTWFEYLGLYGDHMDGIFITVNGDRKKVELEPHWEKYFDKKYASDKYFVEENINIKFNYTNFEDERFTNVKSRISKIIIILADEDLPEHARGVVVNRRCMAINQSSPILSDFSLPSEFKNRVFGYVKLESSLNQKTGESLEDMIKIVEDATHYVLYKNKPISKVIFNKVIEVGDAFKERAGIDNRRPAHVERKRREIANQAQNTTNQILNELGVTGGGTGRPPRDKFKITLEGIKYPRSSNEVVIGESIRDIKFMMKNKTANIEDNLTLIVEVVDSSKNVILAVGEEQVALQNNGNKVSDAYHIDFDRDTFSIYNHKKIFIQARLIDQNNTQLTRNPVPVLLGLSPEPEQKLPAIVFEHLNINNDKGRVDSGDKIENITCIIKNESDFDWELKFRVAIRKDDDEGDILVLKNYDESIILAPSTQEEFNLGDVEFSKELFGHIDYSKLILRAKLLSAVDQHGKDEDYVLSKRDIGIWFNMDPLGSGLFKIGFENAGANSPRARVFGTDGTRDLFINVDHSHFKLFGDGDDDLARLENYYSEVGLKHGLFQAWRDGDDGPFNLDPNDENIDPNDVLEELNKSYDSALSALYGV
ncbi:hypothetical protein OAQ12_03195 [Candidatus Marinimicrobia bacterium]|nr:hypothetical protein [Candidatus Neomarinimicrobiota bacterium]